ncbi:SH3-domain-containing protein [Cylindrobasidium torrendii FP15055 ss-10]|uniref:SH3-domain-containing protein n=1 Tax=Cylindrobasidium torrendii FP15055 ss-10 TaxID=1314674 RepID=A0A0D7AYU7_9AGAR|nr:SH3-domain-containing protein [Cylindrobasidium torrendii FP15055 ss-10]
MSNDALLAHIVAQTQANVDFLVQNNYVTQADAGGILRKLNALSSPPTKTSYMPAPPVAMPSPVPSQRAVPPPPPPPAPAAPAGVTAKALWDYNADGSDGDDLSFSAGDIITIVKEDDEDWWTGEIHGRRGLFPTNYVEKIAAPPARNLPPPLGSRQVPSWASSSSSPSSSPVPANEKPVYKPFMASHRDAPSTTPNSVGLQQGGGEKTKSKYGSQLKSAAVGGVGFGAGSAIGGGLVRAIF